MITCKLEMLEIILLSLVPLLSLCDGQRQYFEPSVSYGDGLIGSDQSLGQTRSLGLALDYQSLQEARQLFPILYKSPSRIYVIVFNTTGVVRSRRIDTGWTGVDNWIKQEDLLSGDNTMTSQYTRYQYDGGLESERGGASMYAVLSLAQVLPPTTPLILITSRKPSDIDLRYQANSIIKQKQIKVYVYWTGKPNENKYYLEELAQSTGGSFQDKSSSGKYQHQLKQVTLLVRDGLKGDSNNKIEVDSSLVNLIFTIKGHVTSATLTSPIGYRENILENNRDGMHRKNVSLSGRESGTWYLNIRALDESTPYSLTVEGTSHLALWASSTNKTAQEKKQVVELWLDGNGVRRVDQVELIDSDGQPIAELGHVDTTSPLDNTFSSTVQLDTTLSSMNRQPTFLRLTATNTNGERLTRLTRLPDEMRLPTSVEVGLGSTLTISPGQRAVIYFHVANNRRQPLFYDFIVEDRFNWIRSVQPQRSLIGGMSTEQVRVELQVPFDQRSQTLEPDIVTLRAQLQTGESVTQRAYLRVGQTSYDSTSPSISYNYNGDCSNTLGPETCYIGTWGANVTIQDYTSGLLQITSRPVALQLDREFIAGTQDPVNARFVATCCQTKVEITAVDTLGNKYSRVVDIERKWLSAGEIAAIVLGCLLLLLLILTIIILICWCCRRNKRSLAIYPDH